MNFEHIRLEQDEAGVATLTLDRPDRLNALNAPLLTEMKRAVDRLSEGGARCLLLTGAGRGFSSGADLVDAGGLPADAGEVLDRYYNPLVEALFALPIPVVAAVNGPAAGAGCSLAMAADLVVAARSAYFLQAFVNIGLVPDAGASWILPRLVGRARALEMMMLGERIPAEQALSWGLVARVAEDVDLMDEAMALARRLASGPTVALGLIRQLVRDADHLSLSDGLAAERAAQKKAGETEDFRRAALAFVRKETPRFGGR